MKNKRNISIKGIITIIFVLSLLISISGIGYLIFAMWLSSAEHIAESMSEDISGSICNQVYSYIDIPFQINEANHKVIETGILDISDEKLRDMFFVDVLSSQNDEIYSCSYGSVTGEYYGVSRNEDGVLEIIKNNATTGGNSWHYSVNEDLSASEIVLQAGQFEPRTMAWYMAAEAAGKPIFSPVYKHFVMANLTISAACPIYEEGGKLQGVLGTHMLLSDIGIFLSEAINKYNGIAIIFEKKTGAIIANSMGKDNFSVLEDGTLKRHRIEEFGVTDILNAYKNYNLNHEDSIIYHGENGRLFGNIKEIHKEGLDWIVITAIPEELFMASVNKSITITIFLIVLASILSLVIYNLITSILLKPMRNLLETSAALSSGDLSKRSEVVRHDEIGNISQSLNKVADKMQYLINNLEENVNERTLELQKANNALEENENHLQLILNSTAEAIYGIDISGKCTFCNLSCIKILGYERQEELLGKDMHSQIHHTHRDGSPFPVEECKILQSIRQGKGLSVDDELFWKADGTPFDVKYFSYPQIKEGKVVGGVITFLDITESKKRDEEIRYLSYHDVLTGLCNRRCFADDRSKIDIQTNLPLSVIFADINGLKMTNDIFGHAAGDELIKKSSEILKKACRQNDFIARVGGDEFIIVLPKTTYDNAEKIINLIKSGFMDARLEAIKCSISLGLDTKRSADQSLDDIMANAENAMYKDKTINRKAINKDMLDTIIATLHSRNPKEKEHSIAVSELCSEIGSVLPLPLTEISKLKRAGYLHDVGKIILDGSILNKNSLSDEECEKMRQHPVVGYRILNLFDDTLDLSEYVYNHHERWDGTGYPMGLKGEQIPLISRIIAVAEAYDRALNRDALPLNERKALAIETIKRGSGIQFDPRIAEILIQFAEKK